MLQRLPCTAGPRDHRAKEAGDEDENITIGYVTIASAVSA